MSNTPTAAHHPPSHADQHITSVRASLSAPFDPREVKFKPQMVKNNRALAIPYIDVRVVEDRLDEVLGVENWQDDYEILADGSVACRLRLNLGGQWVTKMDVGSPSEQPDGGDRMKAAFSDAMKRAAVKFGIGRYLYRLPALWVEYDPAKKQIVQPPQLPGWAVPAARAGASAKNPQSQAAGPTAIPAATLPQSPPTRPPITLEDFKSLMHRKGQQWPAVMVWLAKRSGEDYGRDTKFGDVAADHLRDAEEMLKGLNDVAKANGAVTETGTGAGTGAGTGRKSVAHG